MFIWFIKFKIIKIWATYNGACNPKPNPAIDQLTLDYFRAAPPPRCLLQISYQVILQPLFSLRPTLLHTGHLTSEWFVVLLTYFLMLVLCWCLPNVPEALFFLHKGMDLKIELMQKQVECGEAKSKDSWRKRKASIGLFETRLLPTWIIKPHPRTPESIFTRAETTDQETRLTRLHCS